jgi:hypothetical protein
MAIRSGTKSQRIDRYHTLYRDSHISFNKQVIRATGLVTDGIHLKCKDRKWPCVLHSTSLTGSKVIVRGGDSFFDSIRGAKNKVSLRLAFRVAEKTDPISFFIPAKVGGSNQYPGGRKDFFLLSLSFSQKAPDDLIEIIGQLLEASANAQKRREERILITDESVRELGLSSNEGTLEIREKVKVCLIRDLSFSGAKVLSAAWENLSKGDDVIFRLSFDTIDGTVDIPGKVVRVEEVIGRSDFVGISLAFNDQTVPLEYKTQINNWLTLPTSTKSKASYREEKIGDGLVRIGAMTRAQVEKVLSRQANGDSRKFGQIAIELGYIDDEAIGRYLQRKG